MRALVAKLGLALALLTGVARGAVASPDESTAQAVAACSADAPDMIRPAIDGDDAAPPLRASANVTESSGESVDHTVPVAPAARVPGPRRAQIRPGVAAAQARSLAIAWLDYARLLAAAHAGPSQSGGSAQPPPANRP